MMSTVKAKVRAATLSQFCAAVDDSVLELVRYNDCEIKIIDSETAGMIISSKEIYGDYHPCGLYYVKGEKERNPLFKNIVTAIDNNDNNAWTENFRSRTNAFDWLTDMNFDLDHEQKAIDRLVAKRRELMQERRL